MYEWIAQVCYNIAFILLLCLCHIAAPYYILEIGLYNRLGRNKKKTKKYEVKIRDLFVKKRECKSRAHYINIFILSCVFGALVINNIIIVLLLRMLLHTDDQPRGNFIFKRNSVSFFCFLFIYYYDRLLYMHSNCFVRSSWGFSGPIWCRYTFFSFFPSAKNKQTKKNCMCQPHHAISFK